MRYADIRQAVLLGLAKLADIRQAVLRGLARLTNICLAVLRGLAKLAKGKSGEFGECRLDRFIHIKYVICA